jgi:hypothetical protein
VVPKSVVFQIPTGSLESLSLCGTTYPDAVNLLGDVLSTLIWGSMKCGRGRKKPDPAMLI